MLYLVPNTDIFRQMQEWFLDAEQRHSSMSNVPLYILYIVPLPINMSWTARKGQGNQAPDVLINSYQMEITSAKCFHWVSFLTKIILRNNAILGTSKHCLLIWLPTMVPIRIMTYRNITTFFSASPIVNHQKITALLARSMNTWEKNWNC